MSDDTGLAIRRKKGRWVVYRVNASTGHHNLKSEHETRAEAIEAASDELGQWPYEYGIMYIEPATPSKSKKPKDGAKDEI